MEYIGTITLLILSATALHDVSGAEIREKRQTARLNVRDCSPFIPYYPSTTFNSDVRLAELRRQMHLRYDYQAYIIPGYDAHGSIDLADPDKRIWYMTGFNGTGGVAIVTSDRVTTSNSRAAIWVEKRFELLAKQQIDCNWDIHVLDDKNDLTPWQWLLREYDLDPQDLLSGELRGAGLENGARVGFDPLLMPYGFWYELQETDRLEPRSVSLQATPLVDLGLTVEERKTNLVDRVRIELAGREGVIDPDRIEPLDQFNPYGLTYPGREIYIQDKELYAGYDWQDKVYRRRQTSLGNPILYFKNLRELMDEKDVDLLIITRLDEIAWLFNLRGEDIPYNPLFISFAIVGTQYINLYLYDSNRRLDSERFHELREHLELDTARCTSYTSFPTTCIRAKDISAFTDDLSTISFSKKVWFSNSSNYFVYKTVTERDDVRNDRSKYIMEPSPILLMKAVKNDVEVESMNLAFIADSVTTIEVAAWMDNLLQNMVNPKEGDDRSLTEWLVSQRTETIRESHTSYQYPSYETIAAVGYHSANYYYHPIEDERFAIPTGKMFLYDMGGQYREGTTTLARTFFFAKEWYEDNENRYEYDRSYDPATPSEFQKEVYTRIVLGLIDLSMAKFHTNVYGRDLDAIARQYLWDVGLDYFHPTGYGVGQYLTPHEGPVYINSEFMVDEQPFNRSMFISAGPGYYYRDPDGDRESDFGARVTNVLYAKPVPRTPYEFLNEDESDDVQYLEFETVTFVPFEPRLIKFEYFTRKQLDWYNDYSAQIREKMSGRLSGDALKWMQRRTRFQRYKWDYIGGASTISKTTTAIIVTVLSFITSLLLL
ncbi:xaa-Pro aminopeptidase 1-like [Lytechinus variegatus]|uniref:xaa-Pro aminopeptidase 1-like n=1 Tax=Lytechinus variegatus TaxID=7654 RepID=UPI001BB0FBB6|nr:xaa-Pro aminopeptidase 1-like [Lytechinus variegatus]